MGPSVLNVIPVLPASIKFLNCSFNQITNLPALPASLVDINCSDNPVNNMPALPLMLSFLNCYNTNITCLPTLPASMGGTSPYQSPSMIYNLIVGANINCLPNAVTGIRVNTSLPLCTAPVISAGGPTTFCAGASVILSGNSSNGTWSVIGGTSASITATIGGDYYVTKTNGCGTVTSNHIIVTVNPLPAVSFSGLLTSYPANAASATLTGSPAGGTFSGPGISGNIFSPSTAGVGGPYTISYSYTNANGCTKTSTQQTTIIASCAVPARPGAISTLGGTAKVCSGDVKTYLIANVPGATNYTWTAPPGGIVTSGQGTTAVTITYNNGFTTGDSLRVTAGNACGTSQARALKINRNGAAATPGIITGLTTGVCNSNSIPYSVIAVAGVNYTWTWSTAGANIVSGQGTNAITTNFTGPFVSGSLKVTATNACGTSSARSLSVYARPATAASITGNATVCTGQSAVPYSIAPLTNASSYTWVCTKWFTYF